MLLKLHMKHPGTDLFQVCSNKFGSVNNLFIGPQVYKTSFCAHLKTQLKVSKLEISRNFTRIRIKNKYAI